MRGWTQRQRKALLLCLCALGLLLVLVIRSRRSSDDFRVEEIFIGGQTRRPLYFFIAGIEGAGHGTLREVLKPCATTEVLDPNLHLDGGDDPKHRYAKFFSESLELALQDQHLVSASRRTPCILDAVSTFPIGPEREPARRPDLEVLLDLHQRGVLDLRILVLWRDPLRCIQYTSSRSKSLDPLYLARVAEESLLYLSKQLEQMPSDIWDIINYDEFVQNPSRFESTIAALLPRDLYRRTSIMNEDQIKRLHANYERETLSFSEIGDRRCCLPEEICQDLDRLLSEFLEKREFLWAPMVEFLSHESRSFR
ncbi:hypothetical protein CYME_CMT594C [Cyanidioschyzon merolae strain 10D]|jgi:hypothetical protein|uniref:Sulfotransferase n=1 Tax=Cyanidioschyzon merolae (strain NIES-3377 / 10D) TaxID=280699 RepID=M1V7Y2_CYAM1|nr:hypothetical protein CYME_CMT594C [Cyanidioschyzon merolae strain 10D]BAM83500.1 hypothetical protein CYME_CMT594C [Cyanidioschyzon merolae strain 10D]|eukprot:XP_005539536.1 hypothetical protein CYME_CMT594C [Cyanidioschyzon merolae strain 10D]